MTAARDALRSELRAARRSLGAEAQRRASEAVTATLGTWWESAPPGLVVAGYASADGELDCAPALDAARRRGVATAYPTVVGNDLVFRQVRTTAELLEGRWGLVEPRPDADVVFVEDLDVVLVPLVGFDDAGNRLGRGRGYYDRAFAFLNDGARPARPLLVGLAHEIQRVEGLDAQPHDVALDAVVTPFSGPLTLPLR